MIRLFFLVALLLGSLQVSPAPAMAVDEDPLADLAAIPVPAPLLADPGYLLEGGGFLDGAPQVSSILTSLVGTSEVELEELRRSYMYRSILLADRESEGSDLLADEITLVLEFNGSVPVSDAMTEIAEAFGDEPDTMRVHSEDGENIVYETVVDSVESLTSLMSHGIVLVLVISTDVTGEPSLDSHIGHANETWNRLQQHDIPGLSSSLALIEAEKLVTFADDPVAHQHYLMDQGEWVSSVEFPNPPSATELGIINAYESQQILTLNNASDVYFQTWIAEFDSASSAEAFSENPSLDQIPSTLFTESDLGAIRGETDDGKRYGGYRQLILDDDRVAVVAIFATGNLIISEDQVQQFAEVQAECLQQYCESIPVEDIITGSPDESTPDLESGIYTDPQFGWSLDYGSAGFEVTSLEANQILELQNGNSLATVESVVDRHGDPTSCILEQVRLLETLEEHSEITLGSDEGETPAGLEDGHAWATYTVEPLAEERADQEYTIRIDCYTLVENNASLVVSFTAPRYEWGEESAKGEALRDAISF